MVTSTGRGSLGCRPQNIKKLAVMDIKTGRQLPHMNPSFIRKPSALCWEEQYGNLTEKVASVLKSPSPKRQIVCARSFGYRITTREELNLTVCHYTERAAEKLRENFSSVATSQYLSKHNPLHNTSLIMTTWPAKNCLLPRGILVTLWLPQ